MGSQRVGHDFSLITGGFPDGSDGKNPICNVGDLGLIPGLGRSLGEGNGYPLKISWSGLGTHLNQISKSNSGMT